MGLFGEVGFPRDSFVVLGRDPRAGCGPSGAESPTGSPRGDHLDSESDSALSARLVNYLGSEAREASPKDWQEAEFGGRGVTRPANRSPALVAHQGPRGCSVEAPRVCGHTNPGSTRLSRNARALKGAVLGRSTPAPPLRGRAELLNKTTRQN